MLHLFPIAALVLYIAAGLGYIRLFRSKSGLSTSGSRVILFSGFALHFIFLALSSYQGLVATHPATSSKISLLLVGLFLVFEKRLNLTALGAFLVPLSAAFLFYAGVIFHTTREVTDPQVSPILLTFHLWACVFAIVLLGSSAILSVGIIVKDDVLKHGTIFLFKKRLPSLQKLESFAATALSVGFWLMALGVVSGCFLAISHGVETVFSDARFLWSLATLFVYALLLAAKNSGDLHGVKASWYAIACFASVIVSFFGVNHYSDSFHIY